MFEVHVLRLNALLYCLSRSDSTGVGHLMTPGPDRYKSFKRPFFVRPKTHSEYSQDSQLTNAIRSRGDLDVLRRAIVTVPTKTVLFKLLR